MLASMSTRTLHILVAEDEPSIQKILGLQLKRLGYAATICSDGQQALDLCFAGTETFDLILMDVMMPRMAGTEAIRHIRANERTREIPILCVSGSLSEDGIQAGADAYLQKPYGIEELQAAIDSTLAARRR
jgi:two-component system NtrC family response regulator